MDRFYLTGDWSSAGATNDTTETGGSSMADAWVRHGDATRIDPDDCVFTVKPRDAADVVAERSDKYGHPAKNFSTIADFWQTYIWRRYGVHIDVQPQDVGMFMALVKVAREANEHDPDNLLDGEGYFRCTRMIHGETE